MPDQLTTSTIPGDLPISDQPTNQCSGQGGHQDLDESVSTRLGRDLIMPGGKVDPHAIASAIERARKLAASNGDDAGDPVLPEVTFTLQRDLNTRLDKYLTSRVTFMSRSQLQKLITEGGVSVNDKRAKSSTKLVRGDQIRLLVPPPPSKDIQPENIPLEVLFEDDHLLVVNKAADIIVHPARSENTGTMLGALAWHLKHHSAGTLSPLGDEFARPGVVHRLDRHTSGCIIFAKTEAAHWKLGKQFENRSVDKRYLAVVHGRVEPDVDVIDLPIGPHQNRTKGYREKNVVRHDDLGKHAITICRVKERYHTPHMGELTLVELELKTGRTHQIRVHLSHLGWPIVGDDMYKGRPFADPASGEIIIERQALHAALISFEHPIERTPLTFTAPLRAEMAALIEHLRSGPSERVHAEGSVPLVRLGL